jgi:hypothetical protein
MELAPSVYCDGAFFAERADNRSGGKLLLACDAAE